MLCVGAHSPVLWHLEGMNELADVESLEVDFMERQAVAQGRRPLVAQRAHGDVDAARRLDASGSDRPQALHPAGLAAGQRRQARRRGSELVFFGRLETRKGLDLFCDALDRLVTAGVTVPPCDVPRQTRQRQRHPERRVPAQARSEKWPFRWQIISTLDRDGAMAYLRKPNRVAVLPSRIDNLPYTVLECLGSNIPFVAANTGGIPEMIRPADRDARPLRPDDVGLVAERLASVISSGLRPAPLRIERRPHSGRLAEVASTD